MPHLLQALESFAADKNYCLAVITTTEGSTYRKSGSLMLLDEELNYWGLISGGCLEGDIQQHAGEVIASGKSRSLKYNMRGEDDLVWGMGLGCDGAVNLLLIPLPANKNHCGVFSALRQIDNGESHLLSLGLADANIRFVPLMPKQGSIEVAGQNIQLSQLPRIIEPGDHQKQLLIKLAAPLNLLICGASPDVPPVTSLASQLGWKCQVIDHRAEFANPRLFPATCKVELIKRSQWPDFVLDKFDAAVIMSHQFERDREYLERLVDSDVPYIGLLGPSKRRDQLLADIRHQFTDYEGRIFGPVGLDIGADTPETIALAIVAEIQAVRAGKSVGFCYQDPTR